MIEESNVLLEQYEIKKPDYDYIDRPKTGKEQDSYEPRRYVFQDGQWVQREPKVKKRATIMFTGDITCYEKQIEEAALDSGYDFNYQIAQMKPVFANADLLVGNLETMIFPQAPYRTEKYVSEQNFYCNAPVEFLDALRNAGFDMLTTANNHDLDTGAVGIGATIDNVERMGFIQTGTFKTDKPHFEVIDVSGFKVAIVAFATNHNLKLRNLTKEGAQFLLNTYSKSWAKALLDEARQAGAEVVIASIHWGDENKKKQNEDQEHMAKTLARLGYDCIIGSHSHVLQPYAKVGPVNQKVPVFYCLGNFLSHNVSGSKSRSAVACVHLKREGKKVSISCSYVPVYTSENYGPKKYTVLPISLDAKDAKNVRTAKKIKNDIGKIKRNEAYYFQERIERKEVVLEEPEEEKEEEVAEQAIPPKLSKITEFPVSYDDGKYVYDIYRTNAVLTRLSEGVENISYTLPTKVAGVQITDLKAGAFKNDALMKKMSFGKNIRQIPESACENCLQLEGFRMGGSVTEIKARAFAGCVNLSSAVMRKKVKTIGSKAFAGCENLRSVKIPAGVEKIADDAFEGCTKVVFYCEADSYAAQYALDHGFTVVIMELS